MADEWIHQDEVRTVLAAIEDELAAALQVPDRFTLDRPVRLRLLRLRLVLTMIRDLDAPLAEVLANIRDALAEPLPDQRRPP